MIKTQDLPSASTLAQDDTLVANVGGKTKKVPVSLLTADLIRDGDKSVAGSIGDLQNEINELHQSEIHDVPTTGWTDRTLDGKLYKSYEIILTNEFIPAQCTISLVASGDNVLPTDAEAAAYTNCFATLDDTTLRIYAAAIPGSTFAIAVRGVKA